MTLRAIGSGADTVTDELILGNLTLNSGTANGVLYLSGTTVTSGSALTFDGTNLGVGATATDTNVYGRAVDAIGTNGAAYYVRNTGSNTVGFFGAYYGAFNTVNLGSATNSDIAFYRQNSEQMRLNSSGLEVKQSQLIGYSDFSGIGTNGLAVAGSVGIGTSSPGAKLDVVGNLASSGNGCLLALNGTSDGIYIVGGNKSYNAFSVGDYGVGSVGALKFASGNTINMTLDSSGNLGLGVTPSAWTIKAIDISTAGAVFGTNSSVGAVNNAYWNGSNWIYKLSATASYYTANGNQHQWYTAPSGTAGAQVATALTSSQNGNSYTITTVGTTDFTAIGAASNTVGVTFTKSGGTGTGTGTATQNITFAQAMTLDASGNLLVGTTSNPAGARTRIYAVSQWGMDNEINASSGSHIVFKNTNGIIGSIYSSGTTTSYNTSSDYRLKENIQPMQGALVTVAQLNPVTYNWKADGSAGQGFIAHELQAVVPDCVTGEKDAVDADGNPQYQGVDTSFLVATLCKAIQEQQAIIESLKSRLDAANL